MAAMKRIYLVQFEEYGDAFTAFESYGNAYEFASAYRDSMPGRHDGAADMIREVFLLDAMADVADELDRIGAETEDYWRSRNEQ